MRVSQRSRQRTVERDIRDLDHPPQAWAGAAVSTAEQDDSLENQQEALRDACDNARGVPWQLKEPIFVYKGSRSEFKQADNPVFTGILAKVRAEDGDVYVFKHASRITRILKEGIELLDAFRDRERPGFIHFYQHRKTYDPSNPADRETLINQFHAAEIEARTTRDRTADGMDKSREKGRLGGITPYGYVVHYDAKLRRPPRPVRTIALSCTREGCDYWYREILRDGNGQPVAECPACTGPVAEMQAEIIREIIDWAARGKSLSGIALRLNKRGIPAPTRRKRDGTVRESRGHWTHETVLGIATNPVYIGKICASPSVTGGPRGRDLGELKPSPYPAIADPDKFWLAAKHLVLKGLVRHSRAEEFTADLAGAHKHRWMQAAGDDGQPAEGRFTCNAEISEGVKCGRVRIDRPAGAKYDLSHIAICSVHRAPVTIGNKPEVAPKDVHLNAMRDLEAACGAELEAAAPPQRERYEHAAADSADGIGKVLRAAVADGRLAPGTRLPSSRALATRLGMSRAGVSRIYDGLVRDGTVVSRPQSGVFVAGKGPEDDGKRSYTGRYSQYYRCSAVMDVHVPVDEAGQHIAAEIAQQLCGLWAQGGFTRRITEEHAKARSDLAKARKQVGSGKR
jgi:DNA invertase Pin-like site-specific DNA recombinase